MFSKTAPVAEVGTTVATLPELPVPLSVLSLDLPEPPAGWTAYLNAKGVEAVDDDIGRPAVARADARMLIAEQREAEARGREKAAELERQAVEQDQQRRAQIWGGIPADLISVGVSPAQAMAAAEKDARPRRRSVLEDSLSNSGRSSIPSSTMRMSREPLRNRTPSAAVRSVCRGLQ